MLHLISRRAWKHSQSGSGQGAATPPVPAPAMARKRKRSPSPQKTEPVIPPPKRGRGRPPTAKIVEEPKPLPEEDEEVEQPEEVVPRPSRNRRKSAKFLENEEDSASTASERESEPPAPAAVSKKNRRKSGKAEKSKDVELEEKTIAEEDTGTHMTIVTGKGKKARTTNIHIKPIKEPKQKEVETMVTPPAPEKTVKEGGSSSRGKRKSGKRGSDITPLPPLEIPSDSNITTVREESGIRLKLIISPKDRGQAVVSNDFSPAEESPVEEKKRSKKEKKEGRKSKGKDRKEEVKPETKLKAKLVFGDQILSLDGDKVTHSEKPKEGTPSSSRSKKRKRVSDDEDVAMPPPVVVTADKSSKKGKKGKVVELEVNEDEPGIPAVTPKADKKGKKHRRESKEPAAPPAEESPVLIEKDKSDSKTKSRSHKDTKHKGKDKHKEEIELEDVVPIATSKDKKIKKKKSKHDKVKYEIPTTPVKSDLDLSLDSFEDTDASLVIDESVLTPSKGHSSSSKKKKIKKEKNGEIIREIIIKDRDVDQYGFDGGERSKHGESRKDNHHRSKHKHDKHRHDKHRSSSSSDKKSKHKKHKSMDEYRNLSADQMKHLQGPFSSPDNSMSELSTINTSALDYVSNSASPESSSGPTMFKKTPSSPTKSKKKSKKDLKKSSGKDTERVRMVKDKDGNLVARPKKPLSAYMLWCKSTRPSVVADNPHADFSAISKLMGIKWHQLSEKDKAKWQNMQRKQTIKHKNIPTLSAKKLSTRRNSGHSGKSRSPSKLQPPNMEAIDIAAHLRLLGESLSTVGRRLKEHQGEIEIHGSVSVLLDSTLCALGPLVALTSQVPELNGCSRDTHVSTLENIAYIMPGL